MTHLNITSPAALASAILSGTINGSVHSGGMLFGFTVDARVRAVRFGAFDATFRRGAVGQGLFDGVFAYYGAGPYAQADSAYGTLPNGRLTTMGFPGVVRLPIYSGTDLLTELPLDAVTLTDVQITDDRGCIGLGQLRGGRFNECTSSWDTADESGQPYGVLRSCIRVSSARMVRVEALNQSLCQLLSGSDCDAAPQSAWARQPDSMSVGEPCWSLTAQFAAVSANVP